MHIPVLKNEVLEYLDAKPNKNFIDCTIDGGGHAKEILEIIKPEGKLLGIDRDEEMINSLLTEFQNSNLGDRLILTCENFANLKKIVEKYNFGKVCGILFDLGTSSWHLKESGRGFSFQKDEVLDMRYQIKSQISIRQPADKSQRELTAEEIVNKWPENKIERILNEYGEEKFAKKIAKEISEKRRKTPIETTFQLTEIIKDSVPGWYLHKKIHFATKTFQALRIAVNNELKNLEIVLPKVLEVLEPEGRIVIISFHSLEDRIVKNFFREGAKEGKLRILTKKPVSPSSQELELNPSSRSAKLRAAIKL